MNQVSVSGRRAVGHWALLRAYGTVSTPFGLRGTQRFAWLCAGFSQGIATLDLGQGARIKIGLGDGYWTKLLLGRAYEPAIREVLEGELAPDVPFLDCGANIGYWSILAGAHWCAPVVAVEPAAKAFAQLVENDHMNGDLFMPIKAAVWSRDGEELTLVTHELRHAGASVVNRRERVGQVGYSTETVETISIDSLVAEHFPRAKKIVVKLDVEEAEREALVGARETLARRSVVLLYEDVEGSLRELLKSMGYESVPLGDGNYVARRPHGCGPRTSIYR